MLEAEKATSPDGRFVATLSTTYFQTLGVGTEDMNATVEVRSSETGELVHEATWVYERNKQMVERGREVTGIAFDERGSLHVGARDESIETITLPAPGELSALQVVNRTTAALAVAFPDRAALLCDQVLVLFSSECGPSYCSLCHPRPDPLYALVCRSCERICARRFVAIGTLPSLAMVVAEATRAVAAHATDAGVITNMLSARAAAVPTDAKCVLCDERPAPDPRDLWSPGGRACAECLGKYAKA